MTVEKDNKRSTRDRHHDLQLMRDLEIINTRTRLELGPLPLGGISVEVKRTPDLSALKRIGETPGIESKEGETMRFQHVVMAAAVTMASGCSPAGSLFHRHEASKVENGVLKIPFFDHSFDAMCYDTLRCRVLYENFYVVNDAEPRGPFTERDRENLRASFAKLEFPSFAKVIWISKDGSNHEAKIDLAEIFRSRMVRYPPDLDVNDVDLEAYSGSPHIILVVDDRMIRVYMKAWIALTKPRYPGRKYSNVRHDPVVVYSREF